MKHLDLNTAQILKFQKLIPALHLYIEKYAKEELPAGKARRTGIGNSVESVYDAVLRVKFADSQVEFDHEKIMRQMFNGHDGTVDNGYDHMVKGLTYEYRIDSKLQECLKYDTVDMGLFYASGNPQFAMSGKATHSAHFYLEYCPTQSAKKAILARCNRPIPNDYVLKIVFVDLKKFRHSIVEVDGKYTAGPYIEHKGTWSNDRMLNVSVKWLEENGCAMSYMIEA